MTGETEKDVSGWTIDTLRAHTDQRFRDQNSKLDERHNNQIKALGAAFEAQTTAMHTAHAAAEKAVDKALDAAERAVEKQQAQLDKEFHEHLEQVRHENTLAFINSDKAVAAALASAKEAVTKAEVTTEKRFEATNHYRSQLAEQAATFLPREVGDAAISELRERIAGLTTRMDTQTGRSNGYASLYGWAIAGIGVIISVVVVADALVSR